MGELEGIKKDIITYCDDTLILYQVNGDLSEITKNYIVLDEKKHEKFLQIAKKLGSKIIYYSESFGETNNDDIAKIDLGFIHDGFMHIFSLYTSWYLKEIEEAEELEEGRMSENLADEMVRFAYSEYSGSLTDINTIARAFWEHKGIESRRIDMKAKEKLAKVKSIAEKKIMAYVLKKEKEELPHMVAECIAWASERKLKSLTPKKFKEFLAEKQLNLMYMTQDALFAAVNLELKKN